MASSVKTRKTDEKKRQIAMVGEVSHQIFGAKLPSNRQVLSVFFYNMRFVISDGNAKESARIAIDAAMIYWQQARIRTKEHHKCVAKLIQMHEDWKNFQKTKPEKMSKRLKDKFENFIANLDNLFDIAHANAMSMIRNEEDREFLQKQREDGRPGSMLSVDQVLYAKELRAQARKEQEEMRKLKHAEASKMRQTGR